MPHLSVLSMPVRRDGDSVTYDPTQDVLPLGLTSPGPMLLNEGPKPIILPPKLEILEVYGMFAVSDETSGMLFLNASIPHPSRWN